MTSVVPACDQPTSNVMIFVRNVVLSSTRPFVSSYRWLATAYPVVAEAVVVDPASCRAVAAELDAQGVEPEQVVVQPGSRPGVRDGDGRVVEADEWGGVVDDGVEVSLRTRPVSSTSSAAIRTRAPSNSGTTSGGCTIAKRDVESRTLEVGIQAVDRRDGSDVPLNRDRRVDGQRLAVEAGADAHSVPVVRRVEGGLQDGEVRVRALDPGRRRRRGPDRARQHSTMRPRRWWPGRERRPGRAPSSRPARRLGGLRSGHDTTSRSAAVIHELAVRWP